MLDHKLMKSSVSDRIWELYKTDPEAFKKAVTEYFALGYPGFKVVRADPNERLIYLRDERVSRNARKETDKASKNRD